MPSQHQEDDSGEGEDDAEVQQECLHKFSTRDYIMEPSIFNTLKRCVGAGAHSGTRGEFCSVKNVVLAEKMARVLGPLEEPKTPLPVLPTCLPQALCPLGVKVDLSFFPGISRQEGPQKMSSSSYLRTIQRWPRL